MVTDVFVRKALKVSIIRNNFPARPLLYLSFQMSGVLCLLFALVLLFQYVKCLPVTRVDDFFLMPRIYLGSVRCCINFDISPFIAHLRSCPSPCFLLHLKPFPCNDNSFDTNLNLFPPPGDQCAINVDECLSLPCMNGATCVDGVNYFICYCPPGFQGVWCEFDIDDCDEDLCQVKYSLSDDQIRALWQCVGKR